MYGGRTRGWSRGLCAAGVGLCVCVWFSCCGAAAPCVWFSMPGRGSGCSRVGYELRLRGGSGGSGGRVGEGGGGVGATPPRPDDVETTMRGTPPPPQRRVCFDEANLEANRRDVEVWRASNPKP